MTRFRSLVFSVVFGVGVVSCGGGSGGGDSAAAGSNAGTDCIGFCADSTTFLSEADVRLVLGRAVAQARALGTVATIAVVDRVGNVLAVLRMDGVITNPNRVVKIVSNLGQPPIDGGLEQLELPITASIPSDALAAIAKAVTGAYLSSEGNAFSTRVASQIVQDHFNPGELNQPAGPLFGVQFSQLACSDFSRRGTSIADRTGPQRSPLGLSADPGGFPLYKNGTPVGGVGVISSDFVYGLDPIVSDTDVDTDELISLAATFDYAAPEDRQADRITVDAKTLRYSDVDYDAISVNGSTPPVTLGADGSLVDVRDYYDSANGIITGQAFGETASGVRSDGAVLFPGRDAFLFVDAANNNRFAPQAGALLTAAEVTSLMDNALEVANRSRAQIRRPLGSQARVTISIVDTDGDILAMARTRDAPVFGADVSLQKARTAAFFSAADAADYIESLPDAQYLTPDLMADRTVDLGDYVNAVINFVGDASALRNGIAFSDRAGGNLSRPRYPDGIDANGPGPLSKPPGEWSPFSTGLQLDAALNAIVSHLLYVFGITGTDIGQNCLGVAFAGNTSSAAPRVANGFQIFPGSVPIYKNGVLAGGIGVSGDGIDQDDMISFLGLHNAGIELGTGVQNAPANIRADNLTPQGTRLRYINCPQSPFNDSEVQRVCQGK